MNYKTVMVSLALDKPNDACLAVAGDIAERFEAKVIGIAASELRPPLYFAEGQFAQKLIDEEGQAVRKRLSELEAEFRASVQKRAKSVEWRSTLAQPVAYVAQQARTADVLVVGARAESIVDPCAAPDPNGLVMQAGRPLIVVPPMIQWLDLRSVLVAWKDVREARRAVFDALPLLSAAKDVTIAEIAEEGTHPSDALRHVEDVAAWLVGHGIVASTVVPEAKAKAADQLDEIAGDIGAGVVIAGAYGHSRFQEWVLGGVTRHLATEPRRCSFLSR
ncbi:universal stress protein [Bradyrhizobium sp. Ash2021]|uniref:universal stress protein n=1 Tax=Bradyrhizobium sp. Ash2021 TaxID=2954771 RepID=UPI00281501FE|nr:universal stress protein [Bradyrhizobium sp. Ash2021]WMT73449.1 universal stress protein [Bradyrhizobium sp. Ash2021]